MGGRQRLAAHSSLAVHAVLSTRLACGPRHFLPPSSFPETFSFVWVLCCTFSLMFGYAAVPLPVTVRCLRLWRFSLPVRAAWGGQFACLDFSLSLCPSCNPGFHGAFQSTVRRACDLSRLCLHWTGFGIFWVPYSSAQCAASLSELSRCFSTPSRDKNSVESQRRPTVAKGGSG